MHNSTHDTGITFFKWLCPGLRIKRWISLFAVGISMILLVALYGIRMISESSIFLALFIAAFMVFGLFIVITSVKNILRTFVRDLTPHAEGDLATVLLQKRHERALQRGPRVVVVGGGTGLNVLLKGIKGYTTNISAIVTVTDTGGSSGRLRDDFDMLPPGDIRNCLVALSDAGPLLEDLFQYRFEDGDGLKGHNFGNLFIAALSKVTGCFEKAVKESSRVLAIRGQVIPSTLEKVTLVACFNDGSQAEGETTIVESQKPIQHLALKPAHCAATRAAIDAISNADFIILGPGSLFTSVLPNLLIADICKEIKKSDAFTIYVSNVMTQPGETDNMSIFEQFDVLRQHAGHDIVDACVVNTGDIPEELREKYAAKGQYQAVLDIEKIEEQGVIVFKENIVNVEAAIRHDPELLARALFDIYSNHGERDTESYGRECAGKKNKISQ